MFYNYLHTAIRHLWKKKLYTLINIGGLAIALVTVLCGVLYFRSEHSFDDFHSNNPRLYRINTVYTDRNNGAEEIVGGTGQVQAPAFKAGLPEIAGITRVFGGDILENVKSKDKAFNLATAFVDTDFFKVFSFPLLAGDPSTMLKDRHSIVMTETAALKFFGTTDVLGQRLDVADTPDSLFATFTISGLAKDPPPNSSIQFEVLIPFSYLQMMFDDHSWSGAYLGTFAVVPVGTDLKGLSAKMSRIYENNSAGEIDRSDVAGSSRHISYQLQPMMDIHLNPHYSDSKSKEGGVVNGSKPIFSYTLLGIGFFILLMASINFVNLSLASSLERAKEIGIRKIAGSRKYQIILQFMVESAIVCIAALLAGLVITQSMLPFFSRLADRPVFVSDFIDRKVVFYLLLVVAANILMTGLYPAFVMSAFKPVEVLYRKARLSGRNRIGSGLVVLQFSIAICLLVATTIYYQQMNFIRKKELGYDPGNVVRVDIPPRRDSKLIYHQFRQVLLGVDGIRDMAIESVHDNATVLIDDKSMHANLRFVDQSYLSLLRIPLKEGRNFSAQFGTDQQSAVIVNEAFVNAASLKHPLGTLVRINDSPLKNATIIGVVKNYHIASLKEMVQPVVLGVNDGGEGTILLKVGSGKEKEALKAIEKTFKTAIPGAEYSFKFWDELNAKAYLQEYRWQEIIGLATMISIVICCLGLFGLTHLAIRHRMKEIGIRKVLGASSVGISLLIARDFVRLVMLGLIIATPVAWYQMNQWLSDFAYRIEISVWVFVLAGIAAISIALLTTMFQALRAASANPVASLRTE